jgi:hypothetical protein
MILLWIVFGALIWSGKHMSVHDIKDFHGAYMGESYRVASIVSRFLFGSVVVVMMLALVYLIKNKKRPAQILALLLGGGWMVLYGYVCQQTPYFF